MHLGIRPYRPSSLIQNSDTLHLPCKHPHAPLTFLLSSSASGVTGCCSSSSPFRPRQLLLLVLPTLSEEKERGECSKGKNGEKRTDRQTSQSACHSQLYSVAPPGYSVSPQHLMIASLSSETLARSLLAAGRSWRSAPIHWHVPTTGTCGWPATERAAARSRSQARAVSALPLPPHEPNIQEYFAIQTKKFKLYNAVYVNFRYK